MKTANRDRTLTYVNNQNNKGNISFKHKLQRPLGQWTPRYKSLLIHSLLIGMPINPIYVVEENNIIFPLDGAQRVSTCLDYLNNKFALSKDTPSVTLESIVNGERVVQTYEVAKKRYNKLDPEVQETLMAASLTFCTMTDYTDEEVREMFRRQNSSKPLTNKQLRICDCSEEFGDAVYSSSINPLMEKLLTKAQRKNGSDREIIIQVMMLVSTDKEHDFTSFRSNDVTAFIKEYADNTLSKFETLESAMSELDEVLELENKILLTSISFVLYAAYCCKEQGKDFKKLAREINKFVAGYDSNDEYRGYVVSGTNSKESVGQRLEYWKKIVKKL
jgi:hypothetical protein